MEDKVKELIALYESIIHGTDDDMGLFNCYDTYYKGCWDEKLEKVEDLKNDLNKKKLWKFRYYFRGLKDVPNI